MTIVAWLAQEPWHGVRHLDYNFPFGCAMLCTDDMLGIGAGGRHGRYGREDGKVSPFWDVVEA